MCNCLQSHVSLPVAAEISFQTKRSSHDRLNPNFWLCLFVMKKRIPKFSSFLQPFQKLIRQLPFSLASVTSNICQVFYLTVDSLQVNSLHVCAKLIVCLQHENLEHTFFHRTWKFVSLGKVPPAASRCIAGSSSGLSVFCLFPSQESPGMNIKIIRAWQCLWIANTSATAV